MKNSDAQIYTQFLNGETASFDELMIRYGDGLTVYLHGILHDWHEAEDMMVEAFARIMIKRPSIADGAFKAYLFKTGRNLALRHLQKKNRYEVFNLDDLYTDPAAADYVEKHIDGGRAEILHTCLDRIDPVLKEVLWLIYFEDMSYAQAADIMKVNTKRVDHLLSRAKTHLKKELIREGISYAYD